MSHYAVYCLTIGVALGLAALLPLMIALGVLLRSWAGDVVLWCAIISFAIGATVVGGVF